jgi:tetratricopeptide (TPR) repeat protein
MKSEAVDLLVRGSINSPQHYLCVLGYLNLERGTKADIDRAIEQFEKCRRAYAEFAPAAVGLGECHYALSNAYASPRQEMELVRQFAQQARALGDKSGTAEVLLGIYEHRYRADWNEAERHFQNALQDHPQSTTALHGYGNALVLRSASAKGISKLREALQHDPESLQIRTDLALAHLYSGNTAQARKDLSLVLAREPQFFPARWALGETFLKDREYRPAIAELKLAIGLDPDSLEAQAELAFCLGKHNDIAEAQKIIDRLVCLQGQTHVPPTALAVALLGLNQTDRALRNLRLGAQEHDEWLVWLDVDPVFEELRTSHPIQYQEIRDAVSAWAQTASP